jgi:hypothetical protein
MPSVQPDQQHSPIYGVQKLFLDLTTKPNLLMCSKVNDIMWAEGALKAHERKLKIIHVGLLMEVFERR